MQSLYKYKKNYRKKIEDLEERRDRLFDTLESPNLDSDKEIRSKLNLLEKEIETTKEMFHNSLVHGQCEICCKFTSVRAGGLLDGEYSEFGYSYTVIYCKKCRRKFLRIPKRFK